MPRILVIAMLVFISGLPVFAAQKPFKHKAKPVRTKMIKDPVSPKYETLPKNFVLRPTRRHILGQQY